MNFLCRWVGHKPPVYAQRGWWSPGEQYASVKIGPVDGTGTTHAYVNAKCARCGKHFMLARIHLPKEPK